MRLAWMVVGVAMVGCAEPEPPEPVVSTVSNAGDTELEGFTTRAGPGFGEGLFAGDKLDEEFSDDDGAWFFLSFSLAGIDAGEVQSAELRAIPEPLIAGEPQAGLGKLMVDEIVFETFSADLWNAPVEEGGGGCVLADSIISTYSCDITQVAQNALDAGRPYLQVRVGHEEISDMDGMQDLTSFSLTDPNTNEPGIFEIEMSVLVPEEEE